MSFDKRYPNRKDWRKPYHGGKAVDWTCRSHGSCPWCRGGRLARSVAKERNASTEIAEYSR